MALKMANNVKLRSIGLPHKDIRSFDVADADLLAQDAANPLTDGEWVAFSAVQDATYGKLVRALSTGQGDSFVGQPYLVVAGAGRTDVMTTRKIDVYFSESGLEFDTLLFEGQLKVNDPLTVGTITVDGLTKAGLKLGVVGTDKIAAYVVADTSMTGTDFIRARLSVA